MDKKKKGEQDFWYSFWPRVSNEARFVLSAAKKMEDSVPNVCKKRELFFHSFILITGLAGKVKMATPAVMLMVSPIPVIPLFMLSKAVIEYHFKCGTHGTMAAMVTALLTYRFRLEVNSFTLDQFYPKE